MMMFITNSFSIALLYIKYKSYNTYPNPNCTLGQHYQHKVQYYK